MMKNSWILGSAISNEQRFERVSLYQYHGWSSIHQNHQSISSWLASVFICLNIYKCLYIVCINPPKWLIFFFTNPLPVCGNLARFPMNLASPKGGHLSSSSFVTSWSKTSLDDTDHVCHLCDEQYWNSFANTVVIGWQIFVLSRWKSRPFDECALGDLIAMLVPRKLRRCQVFHQVGAIISHFFIPNNP